jgi:hypothetical protein
MKTVTLSASFDGERIRLEDDYPLPPNARLLVTLLPDRTNDEHAEWYRFAAQQLARAYGDDEPEYPDTCVKEPNPAYEEPACPLSSVAMCGRF